MRTHRLIVAATLTLSVAGTAADGFAQEVTLRYRWTTGEQSRTRVTQHSSTTISVGQPASAAGSLDSTLTQVFRTVVEDVAADGTATLEQVIESVRMDLNTPLGRIVFDSESNGGDIGSSSMALAMSHAYRAMIGQPVRMVVSPTGAVSKINGLTRLMERVLDAQPNDRVMPELLDGFRNAFSDDTARDMVGWGVALFPDRPLRPGDTWQDHLKATVPGVGATTTLREWTLRGVESASGVSTARLAARVTIARDPSAPEPALGPVPMLIGESSGESDVLFDLSRGRLQRVTTSLAMPMTMSLPGRDNSRADMEIRIASTLTLEVIDPAVR